MSNYMTIAAVTTTLQSILTQNITAEADLSDTTVTILPLDKARGNNSNNQLNLFLYQVTRNSAFSNSPMPQQVKPGESAFPPLPLNLHYLVTAFGRDNDTAQPFGHELLGRAMSTLHDYMILQPADIRAATAATLPLSDLDRQIERVRITFLPMSLDELSKLWTGFAMQLRLSAAYEVQVALLDSTQQARTPLPVLSRAKNDQGNQASASLVQPFPTIIGIELPKGQPSALLNDTIVLDGHDLDGTNVGAVFDHPLWTSSLEIPIAAGPDATATQVRVTIPNDAVNWPAGIYTVGILVQRPGDSYRRSSNGFPFSLAPSITITPPSIPAGDITYTATCTPDVLPEQRASLLLGGEEILADSHLAQTDTLTFQAFGVASGDYYVRLRVDGVDSLLVDNSVKPPVFLASQKVTVT